MRFVAVAFLLAILPLASSNLVRASALSACSSDDCWFVFATPTYAQLGYYSSMEIQYTSGLNATATGIVLMVVHNSLGQTVEISTSVLQLAAGANGTAYEIAFGLESGTYSGTFFVVSTSGTAMSTTTTASFTV
jgi:hypothetical protein